MRRLIRRLGHLWALVLYFSLSAHAQTAPGPLTGKHAMLNNPNSCTTCHTTASGNLEFKCLNCHAAIREDQKNGRHISLGDDVTNSLCSGCHRLHNSGGTASGDEKKQSGKAGSPHGSIQIACKNCHTSTSYRPIRPFPDFRHSETRYPLRGMHDEVDCRKCHANLVFTNVGRQCADCHADFHRRQMGSNCEQCHAVSGWRVSLAAVQNHTNRFPLIGAHANADCESCHKSGAVGQYKGLSTDCVSCHLQDYSAAKSLNHQSAQLPTTCRSCHIGMDTWLGAKFDHNKYAGFSLTGGHAQLDCTDCHKNQKYTGTSVACVNCHASDYASTTNPNHAAAGFSKDCLTCHSAVGWTSASFNHGTSTKFPLTGSHTNVQCATCHKNNVYAGLSTDCSSCHLADYSSALNPNHAKAGFSQQCSTCHSTASWAGATFNHSTTAFPLTGAHTSVQCFTCHKNDVFAGLPATCVSCHLTEYSGTTNPSHAAAGFSQQCSTCHSTAVWTGATFNHSTTQFPLTGSHTTVQCSTCHKNNVYAGLSTDCVSCHLTDFNTATNPNHVQAGFPQQCATCHNTASWTAATFNHSTTAFPLTGSHTSVQCATCHKNNVYAGLPTDCASCHLTDFNTATNPNHVQSGFPQQCAICHSTTAWTGATFNHSTTAFPLTGSHTSVQCATCHKNNVYAGLPTTCVSCHLTEYNGTTNPNHTAAGFSQQCSTCHSTTVWTGATFNHSTTPFPLTGSHTSVQCSTCHKN
ncbi:MAG TPA: hypothetical protein VMG30_05805, partial [Acidobacteriota bacterium]|nr:hypothetical protein [Acidobacteriota bacterium]